MSELIRKIYDLLLLKYGPQGWWPVSKKYDGRIPNNREKFEIAIGAILTQNTSWKNVERVLENLGEINVAKIIGMSDEELGQAIKPSGYYNQKVKKIRELVRFLESGEEITRKNLLCVWGIGPETADSIILYAYQKPSFVIDAYTKRVFTRIGFQDRDYKNWKFLFESNIQKDLQIYKEYHALIVELAKRHCNKKPKCIGCPLDHICKKVY
jgi:endonuclease III related protein